MLSFSYDHHCGASILSISVFSLTPIRALPTLESPRRGVSLSRKAQEQILFFIISILE